MWRLGISILATFLSLAPARAEAAEANPRTASIIALLSGARSLARDKSLHDSAVALFKSIEAEIDAPAHAEARDVMARAFREAADGGMPEAWVEYGRCQWNGWGVAKDREAALAAYKKAAALGSGYGAYLAAYNLYWAFKRYDEAYTFAQQAVRSDPDGEAHYLLGLMAFNGHGRPEDIKESVLLHQQAARRGNADAMFELFVFSMRGIGDKQTAVVFLRRAAERGQVRAMANMGVLHATGQLPGIAKDLAESVKWYRRAADKGHAQATATLGVMALRGAGMPKDAALAESYFKRAEELGYDVDGYLAKLGIKRS